MQIQLPKVYLDPLEQFDVFQVLPSIWFTPTNLTLFAILNLLVLFFVIYATIYPEQPHSTAPSVLAFGMRSIYEMVADISSGNIRLQKQVHFPLLFYLFMFILISNLVGLIPYAFTITSSFAVTFFLSLGLFLGINILNFYQHGYGAIGFAVPQGSPLMLAPLIAVVELISYISRVFSLSIRLFANMMAGHTLLKILIGFSWVMLNSKGILILFSIVPWTVVTLVYVLEVIISMLQAYVFVTLISIYINDVILPH